MATLIRRRTTQRAQVSPEGLLFAVLYAVGVGGVSLLLSGAPAWLLALTTLFAFATLVVLWRIQFRGVLSYLDPGLLLPFVITLYTVIPLAAFEYYDFNFAASGDSRLTHINLDDQLIYRVWLCANLAMAGFGAAYLALRKRQMPRFEMPTGALTALWIGLSMGAVVMVYAFLSRQGGEGYFDEYLFFRGLPVFVVQMLNVATSLFYVSAWGLLVYYLATGRGLFALALFVGMVVFFLVTTDARAGLVLLAGGFFVARDHFVKRFSAPALAISAVVGIAIFLLLGLVREGAFEIQDAAGRSEFIAVFVTALDVQQLYITGSTLDMNMNMLLSDLFRLLPQQILTFEKVDPATWYVSTFYPEYAEAGGGLAFGMVAEAVLGGGGLSAFIRGLLLGAIVSLAMNLLTRGHSIWRTIIYIWLVVTLYQCFRDTTFVLGGRFLFQIGPALLLLVVLTQLLKTRDGSSAKVATGASRP